MKKILSIFIVVVAVISIIYFIISQMLKNDYSNYFLWTKNNRYIYLIKYNKTSNNDTLKLLTLKNTNNTKKYKWILSTYDSTLNNYKCDTVITETKYDNFSNDRLVFPLPPVKYFDFDNIFTSIDIKLPLKKISKLNSQVKITNMNFDKKGKVMDTTTNIMYQEIQILNRIYYKSPLFNDTCWVIKGKFNKINASYTLYFNKKFGFVYLNYKYNNDSIQFKLISAVKK